MVSCGDAIDVVHAVKEIFDEKAYLVDLEKGEQLRQLSSVSVLCEPLSWLRNCRIAS